MSEIDRFRLVLIVARAHSISAAASITGLSQPTITRAVKATEQLVGYPLFRRTSDGCVPTGDAPAAFALMESILADYDALADLDAAHLTPLRFAFREGALPTALDSTVARWNREKLAPAKLVMCDDPIAMLQAGNVEFAVAAYDGPFPDGLDHRPIRIIRDDRIDLVHVAPPTPAVAEFLRSYY
ncbi:LysR family transcriptional regulator [Tsukamurella sp. PLM1]|uniref:LysR family transcriptional regulator n=1 Tax=Tsukamurella sp. PLM1 TaxID=2929795 RepID=UPI002055B566|nr:LysR family transcriptional regulator [Tsukamurella sp. PLM1]BDH55525.1 hypothetical protein MTP03_04640 [Tsukamurella sp. PLM1]